MLDNIKENLHAAQILVAIGDKARSALPHMQQAVS